MAILQYLSGYLSKNPVELCNFIICIIAARRRCKKYASTADDADSECRNAKFLGQKVPSSSFSLFPANYYLIANFLLEVSIFAAGY